MKKFFESTLGLGFTLAGATVLYFTLSGTTQKIALYSTLAALVAHYWLVFKDPSE